MTATNTPEIDRVSALLAEEISYTHDAIMAVHRSTEQPGDVMVKLQCMSVAARMMQAQANAAMTLRRLKTEGQQTVTYIHQGVPPTPQKSKTNGKGSASKGQTGGHVDGQAKHGA